MKSLRNILILVLLMGAILGLALLRKFYPGTVTFDWLGKTYKIDIALYLIGILIVNYICMLLYRAWRVMVTAPARYRKMAAKNKQIRAYQQYGKVLTHYFTGHTADAARAFKSLDKDFKEKPLSLMLGAKLAESEENHQKSEELYHQMLLHDETKFIGLKGLIEQSIKKHHHMRALEYALSAAEIKPKLPWLCNVIFDLYIRTGDFDEALAYLPALQKSGTPKVDIARLKASLYLQKAHQYAQKGMFEEAIKHYDWSLWADGKNAHAAYLAKAVLLQRMKDKKALQKHVKKHWSDLALFEVGQLYYETLDGDGLSKYKIIEKLVRGGGTSNIESMLILAFSAGHASMWAEARDIVERGLGQSKQKRFYDILIMIERLEFGQSDQAQKAVEACLDDALHANKKSGWVCECCHSYHDMHHTICGYCKAFGTVTWQSSVDNAMEIDRVNQSQPLIQADEKAVIVV